MRAKLIFEGEFNGYRYKVIVGRKVVWFSPLTHRMLFQLAVDKATGGSGLTHQNIGFGWYPNQEMTRLRKEVRQNKLCPEHLIKKDPDCHPKRGQITTWSLTFPKKVIKFNQKLLLETLDEDLKVLLVERLGGNG